VEILVERAGSAVARAALRLLGGTYGRRVVVLAGKGNNGADGRVAARRLAERGVHVTTLDAAALPSRLPGCDLVIDAAYGTGFRGTWNAPDPAGAEVLAVDIPSGVDGLTGQASGRPMAATATVTFVALKPGLLLEPGRSLAGVIDVVDIGLDASTASAHWVQQLDVARWIPSRPVESHKWRASLFVAAGSPGMRGAGVLAARAAQRAGAGMVRVGSPGIEEPETPIEAVGRSLPARGWSAVVRTETARARALVMGPGLGRSETTAAEVRALLDVTVPLLVDADGLWAIASDREAAADRLSDRALPAVLTPHDGEFKMLTGDPPGDDRLSAARDLAQEFGVVVLLKGSTTVVAQPSGEALVVTSGDARLATAGTGDVLSGIIGALLATGVAPFEAAAAGAWIHGEAARLGPRIGLVAGDLADYIPAVLDRLSS